MPLYEYQCETCMQVVEVMQKLSDPPLESCEDCGGAVRKLFHPVGTVFKGSGFYITDNKSAKRENPTKSGDTASDAPKATDAKPSPCQGCDKACPAAGAA